VNESFSILTAFDALCREDRSAALATVVRVAGSSYRRPGARMLVAADGRTWGGVSGGCLERDVIRRARNLIGGEACNLCRYDTSDEQEESVGPGVALGCQGIIDIFIEPLSAALAGPMPALRRAVQARQPVALATVIDGDGSPEHGAGNHVMVTGSDPWGGDSLLGEDLRQLLRGGEGGVRRYDLPAAGSVDVFFELLRPPQSLILFGGGPDVVPVVAIAKALGWHVAVIASHAAPGFRERFASADVVAAGTEDDPLGGIEPAPDAAAVLMTHNYPRDMAILPRLLSRPLGYLGILGPRRRTECLASDIGATDSLSRLYAPVGLDLGADTPQAIALAIVAEIQAVLAGRPASSLRDRPGPIYPRATDSPSPGTPGEGRPAVSAGERGGGSAVELPYTPSACRVSA
jgi:xanthine/CO dehydrogenase XdhC/CoxF family maturation factor